LILNLYRALERLVSADRLNRFIVFFVRNELTGLTASLSALRPRRVSDPDPEGSLERQEAAEDLGRLAAEVEEAGLFWFSRKALGSRIRRHILELIGSKTPLIRAYLDIDGVLLMLTESGGEELVPDFKRIMDYLRGHFDCRWLTTHVRGDAQTAAARLEPHLRKNGLEPSILDGIKPTAWTTLKTEAVDFRPPFLWLDDDPLSAELEALEYRKCRSSLVLVDRRQRSGQLTVRRLRKARRRVLDAYLERIT